MQPFRYTVNCKPKINCFEPKALGSECLKDLRPTMFGAAYKDVGYDKLPDSNICKILWEVTQHLQTSY